MVRQIRGSRPLHKGFSLIELLVVLGVIALLSAISLPYVINYKSRFKSEDQALKTMDLMREASQLALTRRRTFRLEIDLTDNALLLIDENGPDPDTLVKKFPLENPNEVRIDGIPQSVNRPNPPNYADIAFSVDSLGHVNGSVPVIGHSTWAARFRSNGSVVNANNVLVNSNVYFWPPMSPGSSQARSLGEVRAVTIMGGSGAVRYWKHDGTAFRPNQ